MDFQNAAGSDDAVVPGSMLSKVWVRALTAWVLVFVALLFLYAPALNGQFVWDDNDNITRPELRDWQGLQRIWFHWGATQTYYPVLHTLYWIEQAIWGYAPLGYHVASILFHSISVCLVYWIVRRLKIPGALLAAVLFAVHPVYVESIAWITEQKNTLSVMFSLASVLAYLHFDVSRRRGTYALAIVFFLLSLESKATAVTLPVALVVILWWQRGSLSWRRDLAPLIPWFALSLLIGTFTVWYERVYVGVQGNEFVMTPVEKCLVASRAVWFYLSKLFWPSDLILFYPRWNIDSAQAWQYIYVAGVFLMLAAAWVVRRRIRGPLAALLFFLGTLFPLLGFFSTYIFRYTYVCDHFQYFPSLGIVVLVSAAITLLLNRLPDVSRYLGQAVCVLLLGGLAVLSFQQSKIYADIGTLFQAVVAKNPDCWMAYHNMGLLLAHDGRTQDAIAYYEKSLKLNPEYPEAHNNLGLQLASLGRHDLAMEHYHRALSIQPNYPGALTNLGNALLDTGHPDEAMKQYNLALEISPDFSMAHFNLANLLSSQGQLDDAIEHYRDAVRVRPENADFHYNLGIALARAGKTQEALSHFEQAVRLKPGFANAHNNLGNALLDAGRFDEAIREYRQALRLDPNIAEAHKNLATVLLQAGRLEEATDHLRLSLALEPADAASYVTLTKTLATLHRSDEALATAQKALELARLQHDEALTAQIQNWIAKYRAQLAN